MENNMDNNEIELKCLEDYGEGTCEGQVQMRLRSSDWKSFPRCDKHWAKRVQTEQKINSRYGGSCAPRDFDPGYAGERWEDDY
jgi:hypothetical protein